MITQEDRSVVLAITSPCPGVLPLETPVHVETLMSQILIKIYLYFYIFTQTLFLENKFVFYSASYEQQGHFINCLYKSNYYIIHVIIYYSVLRSQSQCDFLIR